MNFIKNCLECGKEFISNKSGTKIRCSLTCLRLKDARRSLITHCAKGHAYTTDAKRGPKGRRVCSECDFVRFDMTGYAIGKLKVIKRADAKLKGRSDIAWIVRCECGKQYSIGGNTLRNIKNNDAKCRKCFHKASGLIGPFGIIYSTYQHQASKRCLEFSLTPDQFKDLVTKNCHYCNQPPSNISKHGIKTQVTIQYSGIDRVDNNLGYTLENCVTCCKVCNRAKREMSYKDFIVWMKQAGEHARNL